ncbi:MULTISPECIES: C39 family peptidase [unclassified Ruminococcus]|uniref:C39 family peptidase n=1 Tax=unclassified Ruminococcus TaxID=2608920 RepID=UPI00210C7041|nr:MULTISPECIES: C39 family peptidase [unclassified Ruminococcus]
MFVILAALFIAVKVIFPFESAETAMKPARVEKQTVVNLSSAVEREPAKANVEQTENDEKTTESTRSIDTKQFTDESKLAFEQSEYNAQVFASVDLKLKVNSDSILPTSIKWTLSDEKAGELKVKNGTSAVLTINKVGKFEVTASSPSGLYAKCTVVSVSPNKHRIENVPFISQNGQYPSGCESISATMLLNYYNYDITPETFIDGYLHMDYLRISDDGMYVVGPDPYTAFIGTPYNEDSLGCYPPVIVDALNKVFDETDSKNTAKDTTGMSLEELIDTYIVQDEPVLVWSTMYLWSPVETDSWIVQGASENSPYNDGDIYNWIANEHCLVLTGYDEHYYYFNDPLSYGNTVQYEKSAFNMRFEQLGKCSVAINGGVLSNKISVKMPQE